MSEFDATSALALLERSVRLIPPLRARLANDLPRLAEYAAVLGGSHRARLEVALRCAWDDLGERSDAWDDSDLKLGSLGAALGRAADIVGVALPPLLRQGPSWASPSPAFERFTRELPVSDVYALLVNAEPRRVCFASAAAEVADDNPVCSSLVRRYLGVREPRWTLGAAVDGDSKDLALVVKALTASIPEAAAALFSVDRFTSSALGVTGALDDLGAVRPVEGVKEKVRRFLAAHPEGRVIVPAEQLHQAREACDEQRGVSAYSRWSRQRRNDSVLGVHSVEELLVRLGVESGSPSLGAFAALGATYSEFRDWRGRTRAIDKTVSVSVTADGTDSNDLGDVLHLVLASEHRRGFIVGGPGSGKSVILRQLAQQLSAEHRLHGPAVRIDSRAFVRSGYDLARVLIDSARLAPEPARALAAAVASDHFRGTWLLVDGLDELPRAERDEVRRVVEMWPGPALVAARPLPSEHLDGLRLEVQRLDRHEQRELLEREGRQDLAARLDELFTPDGNDALAVPRSTLATLASTPLGLSVLAGLPADEVLAAERSSDLLRRAAAEILARSVAGERLDAGAREVIIERGLPVLGGAAWAMLRRGGRSLEPRDRAQLAGDAEAVGAVRKLLEAGDLVGRISPDEYEFSHRVFAELCAAMHLASVEDAPGVVVEHLGAPGVDEVAVLLANLVEDRRTRTRLVDGLLRSGSRPLTGFVVALRILEANGPGGVDDETALRVLLRGVRLHTHATPGPLPAGANDDRPFWTALEKWGAVARANAERFVEECAPAVRETLRGQGTAGGRTAIRLARLLSLELPIATELHLAANELRAKPAGPWVSELEPLLDDQVAASIWVDKALRRELLRRIDLGARFGPGVVRRLIQVVADRGSKSERRQLLARVLTSAHESGIVDEGDWETRVSWLGGFANVANERWEAAWEWLVSSGVVTEPRTRLRQDGGFRQEVVDPDVEKLIVAADGEALDAFRWRAFVARTRLDDVPVERMRDALRDRYRPLRIAALTWARKHGLADHSLALASAASLDDAERWCAHALLGTARTAPVPFLLDVLTERDPIRREERGGWETWSPAETCTEREVREQGRDARRALVEQIASRPWDKTALRALLSEAGSYPGLVGQLVGHIRPPEALTAELLADRSVPHREVLATAVYHPYTLLEPYENDEDPKLAEVARRVLKEAREREANHAKWMEQRRDEEAAHRIEERKPLTDEMLRNAENFGALWELLQTHEPSGEAVDDDWEERDRKRRAPTLTRLRALMRPSDARTVVRALGDRHRGRFAIALLRDAPPRACLDLLSHDQESRRGAVEVLKTSPYRAEAASRIREVLLSGHIVSEEKPELMHRDAVAEALDQVIALGGVAALLPLLDGPDTPVRAKARRAALWQTRESSDPGDEVARWAAAHLECGDPELETVAWNLLGHMSDRSHVGTCRVRLESEENEEVASALLRYLGRHGDTSDLQLLRRQLERPLHVARSAVDALAEVGGAEVCDELIALLTSHHADTTLVALHVMQFGSAEQVVRAAVHGAQAGWEYAREYATQPEHFLLFARNLRYDDENASFDDADLQRLIRLADRLGRHEVGRCLIRADALSDDPFNRFTDAIEELGVRATEADRAALLEALSESPGASRVLSWLCELDGIEQQVVATWERCGVDWWTTPE